MGAAETDALVKVRDDLLSGEYFATTARSHRSRHADVVVVDRRDWSRCVEVIARMAARSDALAQVAAVILPRLNLYQTNHEMCANAYEAAARCIAVGYDDAVGRSGPEGSWRVRRYTIEEVTALALRLAEATGSGVGWALSETARLVGVI